MAENFLVKKVGDLPVWAWGLVAAGGIGVGFFIVKSRSTQGIPGGAAASNTSAGNVLPDLSGASFPQSAGQITPGAPFPTVGPNQTPVFPGPGWTPILDGNGNVIGWNPPGAVPPPQPGQPPQPSPPGQPPQPTSKTVTVRPKTTTGVFAGWDKTHTGVPVRSAANANAPIQSYAAYGSGLTVLPTQITGGNNFGNPFWYQAQGGGFVSTSDALG